MLKILCVSCSFKGVTSLITVCLDFNLEFRDLRTRSQDRYDKSIFRYIICLHIEFDILLE